MSEKIDFVDESEEAESAGEHQAITAVIGALSLAQETGEKLADKLITHGKEAQEKRRQQWQKRLAQRNERVSATNERVSQEVQRRMDNLLHRFNLPSKRDIDRLNDKITHLAQQAEALRAEMEASNKKPSDTRSK